MPPPLLLLLLLLLLLPSALPQSLDAMLSLESNADIATHFTHSSSIDTRPYLHFSRLMFKFTSQALILARSKDDGTYGSLRKH